MCTVGSDELHRLGVLVAPFARQMKRKMVINVQLRLRLRSGGWVTGAQPKGTDNEEEPDGKVRHF